MAQSLALTSSRSSSAERSSAPSAERTASEIIDRWRRLEHQLSEGDPDRAHVTRLEIEIQRQRHDYQRAMSRAIDQAQQLRAASRSSMFAVGRSAAATESARATLRRVREDTRTRSRLRTG